MAPIPCPSCGQALPAQPVRCPSCQLPLTGPEAALLWQLDQRLAALQVERLEVIAALRARGTQPAASPSSSSPSSSRTATAHPTVPGHSAAFPSPTVVTADGFTAAPAPVSSQAPTARRSWSTQQTLLAIGVLLVLVASSIALAVAWFVIGRYGQVIVMGGLTSLAAWSSLRLSRRGLSSSAEALALVAGGLMLLDATAARRFGLLGLDSLDARAYTAVLGLLVAVVLAALHRRDRRIAAFALASLTSASVGWAGLVALADAAATGATIALAGAVVFGAARVLLPESLGLTRRAAAGPASGWAAVALLTATGGALASASQHPGPRVTFAGLACVALLAVLATAGALTVRRVVDGRATELGSRAAVRADWAKRALTGDWRAVGLVALVASLAVPAAVGTLGLQVGAVGTAVLAVVTGAAAVALLVLRPATRSTGDRWLLGQAGLAVLLLVGVAVAHGSDVPTTITLLVVSAVATATAVLRPSWRAAAVGTAALALLGAVTLASGLGSPTLQVLTVTTLALVLAAAALARPGRSEELPLGAVAGLAFALALLQAVGLGLSEGIVATVLTALTVATIAAAVLRELVRPVAEAVAAVTGTSALWLAGGLGSPDVQWILLALVAALLVALASWRRGTLDEVVLGTGAALTSIATVAVALDRSWPHAAAGAAAAYGLIAVAYAAPPHRRAVVTAAVVGLTGATWIELLDADVTRLEAYTVPLALLLLAAGLWSHRELGDRSWTVAGPGLAVALLPSALATAVGDDLPRALATVTLGAGLLALGAWRRWQSLVVLGALAAALVAVTQLGPMTLRAPRFLTLGTVGVALLLVGARYEQSRAGARNAVSWLSSMS
ncbi:hypothetical protein GCM10009867_06720 [Pedococcus aerophilus]|uniref:DUF2157 domain-containing protein n=1 Tax=Pedococcus aerophilus TaxID=436356 RepID=A0ABP6GV71_9MICO